MLSPLENLCSALVLISTAGINKVFADCELPADTDSQIFYSKVNEAGTNASIRYLVRCVDENLKLFPLGEYNDIYCEDSVWRKSGHPDSDPLALGELKCLLMCADPTDNNRPFTIDDEYMMSRSSKNYNPIAKSYGGGLYYIPGVKINLDCTQGLALHPPFDTATCGGDGRWTPKLSACVNGEMTTKNIEETGVSVDPANTLIISTTVSVVAFVLCVAIMVTIAVRAKWRVVCRKRRVPTSHPDDINRYTQLDPPSYAEATGDLQDCSSHSGVYSVYRPTTTGDYRPLSSLESSSHGESESLSAGSQSHRHSLFSGSSANYRSAGGDDISDILLHGDHLSMSDTSTLVTVNTYDSNPTTASNPSLTHSRRGVAGSMSSNTTTSMDDAPLIVRGSDEDFEERAAHGSADC